MQIPFRGRYSGMVADKGRKRPYRGHILITESGIQTSYDMVQGKQNGKLSVQCVTGDGLVFNEAVGSWSGTLSLSLDADQNLICVWRKSGNITASATMQRIE